MRSGLDKPLATLRSPLGVSLDALSAYAILGEYEPKTVADFAGIYNNGTEYYRVAGSATTFENMFDYSDTASLRTMVDSDGGLKWPPNNRIGYTEATTGWAANEASISTITSDLPAGITATTGLRCTENTATALHQISYQTGNTCVAGQTYTLVVYAKSGPTARSLLFRWSGIGFQGGVVDLSDGTTSGVGGNVTSLTTEDAGGGWWKVTLVGDATNTGGIYYLTMANPNSTYTGDGSAYIDFAEPHMYVSSLGGMVDNPDTGTSYVPNSSGSIVCKARRNHYRWTGAAYTKKGILLESAAATNLVTDSQFPHTWSFANGSANATGPTGVSNSASTLTDNGGGGAGEVLAQRSYSSFANGTQYTFSAYAAEGNNKWFVLRVAGFTSPADVIVYWDLSTGLPGTVGADVDSHDIEFVGEYDSKNWYRCHLTFTASTDASGLPRINIGASDGSLAHSDLDGTISILCTGAQLEVGSVPSSYVPSDINATVTRAAETLKIANADMAQSTTEMSWDWQGELSYADNSVSPEHVFGWWEANSSNRMFLYLETNGGNTGSIRLTDTNSGVIQYTPIASPQYSPGLNTEIKFAVRQTTAARQMATTLGTSTVNATSQAIVDFTGDFLFYPNFAPWKGNTQTIALFRQDDSDWTEAGIEEAVS